MPRTREEMLDDGNRGLERHDRAIGETLGLLDGWLVTLSSASLAGPFIFSANARLPTYGQWWLLASAYALLALTIASILARRVIQSARVGRQAAILKVTTDFVREDAEASPGAAEEAVATVERLETTARRLAHVEGHLRWISVALFVIGMMLMGVLALLRALPPGSA